MFNYQVIKKACLYWLCLCLSLLVLSAAQPAEAALYGGRTPASVVAFYYPWYDIAPNYNVWDARGREMASQPANRYNSGDVEALKTHMRQAQSAGIDAFAVTYDADRTPAWTQRIQQMLENAPQGFSIAVHFEVSLMPDSKKNPQGVIDTIREIQNRFFTHPSYFRYQGRPVMYVWWPQQLGGDVQGIWNNIRNQTDPNHTTIWSVDTIDQGLLNVFDSIHFFSGAKWANNPQGEYTKLKNWATGWNNANPGKPRRLSTSSVTPGYDDKLVLPARTPEFRDREGGNYYRRAWDAAVNTQPDLVTISTWNEWFESSAIEPGRDWGNTYLDITASGVDRLKGYRTPLGDASILKTWRRSDLPRATGAAGDRSWIWGPQLNVRAREPYAESPGGSRMVYYFDKSRMEINSPGGALDVNDQFYVTNGLLPIELMSGRVQTGNNARVQFNPAQIPVAGDPQNNSSTPTYAALAGVSTLDGASNKTGDRTGQLVLETLTGSGQAGRNEGYTGENVRIAIFIREAGHNIAAPFWEFVQRRGPVYEDSSIRDGLVVDWLFAMGYPIGEPYWIKSVVGGQTKDVLLQCFERRCLTYTPSNSAAFKVEMGNVGLHYFSWRYNR
jgi:hypothetical protein